MVLAADTAEIGGSVLLRNGFTAEGAISMRGTRIGSSLECDGASLVNATEDGAGIALAAIMRRSTARCCCATDCGRGARSA